MTIQPSPQEVGTPPILIAEAEAERFNQYSSELLGFIFDGDPCPEIAGDRVYDAVWTLRVYDQELAPLQGEIPAEVSMTSVRQSRLNWLENTVEAILTARELHPAGKGLDPMEGLEDILKEMEHTDMPLPRPMDGFGRILLQYAGAADDEDRFGYTNDDLSIVTLR